MNLAKQIVAVLLPDAEAKDYDTSYYITLHFSGNNHETIDELAVVNKQMTDVSRCHILFLHAHSSVQ